MASDDAEYFGKPSLLHDNEEMATSGWKVHYGSIVMISNTADGSID